LSTRRLAELLRHLLADVRGERVAGAADGERHHELDGLVGIALRRRKGAGTHEPRGAQRENLAIHPSSGMRNGKGKST
jgi:hypothetical protein